MLAVVTAADIAEQWAADDVEHERVGLESLEFPVAECRARASCVGIRQILVRAASIELIAERGCTVAHCPRSNSALGCPTAPIGVLLDMGVRVGIGMDSAASSGMIDMFAEMRETVRTSRETSRPLTEEEVWHMATRTDVLPSLPSNALEVGSSRCTLVVRR